MNEDKPKKPELRVLSKEQGVERLDRPSSSARMTPSGSTEKTAGSASENIEILQPDEEAKLGARTFEPDVASILDTAEEELDSEEGWASEVKKTPPLGWFVLGGIVICGLAMWATVAVFKAQPELVETEEEKKEMAIDKIKETKAVRLTLQEMKDCARGYLMADTVEEKVKFVRHPERVKPLMVNYYKTHPIDSEDFRHFEKIRSMGLDSLSFVYGQVELHDGNKHKLILEQLADGSFRVDWESDVCYLPVPWKQFVAGEHTEAAIMRVFLKPDTFYAYEFRDEDAFDCYQLTTRDSVDHVFGFVRKGSETALSIKRVISLTRGVSGKEKAEPLMLELRSPTDSHSKKCVWIDRLVSTRWTYVRSPQIDEKK